MNRRTTLGVLVLLVLGAGGSSWAQEGALDELRVLEAKIEKVAEESLEKTVCIRSSIPFLGGRVGYGSGAIIDESGLILTCAHVIERATQVTVILPDGRELDAEFLGRNDRQDYAMLKIDAAGLPAFELGASSDLVEGQWVVALGHPGGPYADVQPTVAAGRVTGLNRKLPIQMLDRYYDAAIQHDAPIFGGNSGGPLVDLGGHLVGLNGAILVLNENSYAVPIDEIRLHLEELKAGKVIEGRTASAEDFSTFARNFSTGDLLRFYGEIARGLYEYYVGDNETLARVADGWRQFREDLARYLGQDIEAVVEGLGLGETWQDLLASDDLGEAFDVLGRDLGDWLDRLGGEPEITPRPPLELEPPPESAWLGVRPAGEEACKEAGGVVVREVVQGGPAAEAGVLPGDVIFFAGEARVRTPLRLAQQVWKRRPGDTLRLRVVREKLEAEAWPRKEEVELEVTLIARPDEDGGGE